MTSTNFSSLEQKSCIKTADLMDNKGVGKENSEEVGASQNIKASTFKRVARITGLVPMTWTVSESGGWIHLRDDVISWRVWPNWYYVKHRIRLCDGTTTLWKVMMDLKLGLVSRQTWSNIGSILEHLLEWNKKKFEDIPTRIRNRRLLDELRIGMDWDLKDEAKLELEFDKLFALEERYWKTRSRVDWLLERDKSTVYFHRKASQRQKKNSIGVLKDDSGAEEGMIDKMLTKEEVDALMTPFTPAEVLTVSICPKTS
ncbi:hypothetical protein M9H77_26722 [Catharanthus roseus]|uniref:Uncharacterized protein n=1 Tax=Catharanthus roseus TaxID=4058 RepID=A0ACC0ACN0_CATRO|nr:hypothetical protein M9H77_26722 [Catharanthus roseus]